MDKEIWIRCAGTEISGEEILNQVKITGQPIMLETIAVQKVMASFARKQKIEVSPQQLQERMSEFFEEKELSTDERVSRWLAEKNLTRKNVEDYFEEELLARMYQKKSSTYDQIAKRFQEHRANYARARVQVLHFKREETAREMILAVREGESDWPGGTEYDLIRGEAPDEIAAALFSSQPGELIGPIQNEKEQFQVWCLIERKDPMLDEAMETRIQNELAQEMAQGLLEEYPLEFLK